MDDGFPSCPDVEVEFCRVHSMIKMHLLGFCVCFLVFFFLCLNSIPQWVFFSFCLFVWWLVGLVVLVLFLFFVRMGRLTTMKKLHSE